MPVGWAQVARGLLNQGRVCLAVDRELDFVGIVTSPELSWVITASGGYYDTRRSGEKRRINIGAGAEGSSH